MASAQNAKRNWEWKAKDRKGKPMLKDQGRNAVHEVMQVHHSLFAMKTILESAALPDEADRDLAATAARYLTAAQACMRAIVDRHVHRTWAPSDATDARAVVKTIRGDGL